MTLPFPLSEEPPAAEAEAARILLSKTEFLKGVVAMDGLPPPDRVEVCFAGRSNVGKSSLINALTGRKALARASNTPGRTQEINFFETADTHYLVDLPGYGYAEAPLAEVRRWQALLRDYLRGRASLRRAFLLIDARHGPRPADEEIMSLLGAAAVPFQVVLTKLDKRKGRDAETALAATRATLSRHPAAHPEIVGTSSAKGTGIAALRVEIARLG